jgi:hypothetical protein
MTRAGPGKYQLVRSLEGKGQFNLLAGLTTHFILTRSYANISVYKASAKFYP